MENQIQIPTVLFPPFLGLTVSCFNFSLYFHPGHCDRWCESWHLDPGWHLGGCCRGSWGGGLSLCPGWVLSFAYLTSSSNPLSVPTKFGSFFCPSRQSCKQGGGGPWWKAGRQLLPLPRHRRHRQQGHLLEVHSPILLDLQNTHSQWLILVSILPAMIARFKSPPSPSS